MTTEEARAILATIADGFDPRTGEAFPRDGLWSDPAVLRALFAAVKALERPPRVLPGERPPRVPPGNAGVPWTPAEDEALRREYASERNILTLARSHGRSRGAIAARLDRLGLPQVPPAAPTIATSRLDRSAAAGPSEDET